ncbi:TRAF-like family protein [Raphanus sativus]|nr:TRAF-like family protein [Raphanus sativus]
MKKPHHKIWGIKCRRVSQEANFRFTLLNQSGKVLHRATGNSDHIFFHVFDQNKIFFHVLYPIPLKDHVYSALSSHPGVIRHCHLASLKKKDFWKISKLIIKVDVEVVDIVHEAELTGQETIHDLLLSLIETLRKPPQSFFNTELSNAESQLNELAEAGFKLDWLKSKLEEVSLGEKQCRCGWISGPREVEQRIKNLELTLLDLKVELKGKV